MNIIAATSAAPVRPRALADGVHDAAAEAWSVFEEVQNLARLGVDADVAVSRQGRITVSLTVSAEAAGVLPALIRELEDSALTRTPTRYTVTGTICEGNIRVQVSVPWAEVTVAELEALVAAVDIDLEDVLGAGGVDLDDAKAGRA